MMAHHVSSSLPAQVVVTCAHSRCFGTNQNQNLKRTASMDAHVDKLRKARKRPPGTVKVYSPDQFSEVVCQLRLEALPLGLALSKLGLVGELVDPLIAFSDMSEANTTVMADALRISAGSLNEVGKVMLAFAQIVASVTINFPAVEFPTLFDDIAATLSIFFLDFFI